MFPAFTIPDTDTFVDVGEIKIAHQVAVQVHAHQKSSSQMWP
jgi:hypothetical protein